MSGRLKDADYFRDQGQICCKQLGIARVAGPLEGPGSKIFLFESNSLAIRIGTAGNLAENKVVAARKG